MTTKTTKISLLVLASVLPVLLLAQTPESTYQSYAEVKIDAAYVAEHFPEVGVTDLQKQSFVDKALNVDGVKAYATSGWEYGDIEYYGVTEPLPKFTNAVVTLKLTDQKNAIKSCENNIYATVDFDLGTGKIVESVFPTKDTVCREGISLGRTVQLEVPEKEELIPEFIPQADAASQYYIATNDNTGKYGGWVWMTTPTIDDNDIFDDMDEYLGFTFNQDFGTDKFLQAGWLLTTKEGCTGCDIDADSKNMVYVDEAHWGDLQPRKMAGTTYIDNSSAIVYIICLSGDIDYQIIMWYGSTLYIRDSGVDCDESTTGLATNNSVFIENANTVSSSTWADDITSVVKAYSADEFNTQTTLQPWQDSSAKGVSCAGHKYNTSYIDGDLENSNTAEWDKLRFAGYAC